MKLWVWLSVATLFANHARCGQLTPSVVFKSYYYLPSSVPFFQIADSFWRFTQAVIPVYHRCDLSGFYELAHYDQVLFAEFGHQREELLAHEA